MAKSLKAQVEAARKARDKAYWAVANAYPEKGAVTFGDILAQATDTERSAMQAANKRLDDLERQALDTGKAWSGAYGMLNWYR